MHKPISTKRWKEAQKAEKAYHIDPDRNVKSSFERSYKIHFDLLKTDFEEIIGVIIEVGTGCYPCLSFCPNVSKAFIIEPLELNELKGLCENRGFDLINEGLEAIGDTMLPQGDEVWLFNVMQHILDPELFIQKCKQIAPVIRYFEPIDYPTHLLHPHTYTKEDFDRWFPGSVNIYQGGSISAFHESDCAYGTWINNEK